MGRYDRRFLSLRLISICGVRSLSHARMLNAYTPMQNRFAGIKPSCDLCNPTTQTIRLLAIATRSPIQDFRASSIVARTVRKQER